MLHLHTAIAADTRHLEWAQRPVRTLTQHTPLVFVVDPHEDSRALMRLLFETGGFRVAEHSEGERVVAAIRQLRPDLIILEERLPHVDGRTACRRLRSASENIRHTPVIFISSSSEPSSRRLAFEAGCTLYFVKPVDVLELMSAATALLTHTSARALVR